MRLTLEPPPERGEPIAPMINIVFLLLIFFLMSATFATHAELEATPPLSDAQAPAESGRVALIVSAEGEIAYAAARGEAAIAAAARAALADDAPLRIRADAAAPARRVVETVARLRRLGVSAVRLTTQGRAR